MIGAGAVGLGTAWHLHQQGCAVSLFDPRLNEPVARVDQAHGLTGSTASLGVLMGHVFRRSSGRGWRMRQRSMALWPDWVDALQRWEPRLRLHTPLVQVAGDAETFARMGALDEQRGHLGLKTLEPGQLSLIWPGSSHGGLRSEHDGRVNPLLLQIALRKALKASDVVCHPEAVDRLERQHRGWTVTTAGGRQSRHDTVVVCTALASEHLLAPLGHQRPMTAVLGQAVQLKLTGGPENWHDWPGVLVDQGFNLIPDGPGRLWLGATLEPGTDAMPEPFALMRSLNERAPDWLREADVIEQWSGLRARPVDRPAPLLDVLEPGLILATGHYRNGVLLTPATAEWVESCLHEA